MMYLILRVAVNSTESKSKLLSPHVQKILGCLSIGCILCVCLYDGCVCGGESIHFSFLTKLGLIGLLIVSL